MEGYAKGDVCNSDGCKVIIQKHDKDGGCSCHINPPCSYCETPSEYCPGCGWDAYEEYNDSLNSYKPSQEQLDAWDKQHKQREERESEFRKIMFSNDPVTEFNYLKKNHTHFSMEVEGYYPPEMSREDVYKEVKGSFGGRFTKFQNGRFSFIAYTD